MTGAKWHIAWFSSAQTSFIQKFNLDSCDFQSLKSLGKIQSLGGAEFSEEEI